MSVTIWRRRTSRRSHSNSASTLLSSADPLTTSRARCGASHVTSCPRSASSWLLVVKHADLVDLLRGGVTGSGTRWADLGAGEGAFTLALADLLGPGAHITAVDRDERATRELGAEMGRRFPATTIDVVTADFTRPLSLSDLDGVVMANSLHFVRDKAPVLER